VSGATRVLFVLAGLIVLWFVWLAIEVRVDEPMPPVRERARAPINGNAARRPQESERSASRESGGERGTDDRRPLGQRAERPARAVEGRQQRDLAERRETEEAADQDTEVVVADLDRPSGNTRPGAASGGAGRPGSDPGGAAGDSRAQGNGDTDPAQAASQAPTPFVPGPGDLKPYADLSGAELGQRDLQELELQGASFAEANLRQANLEGADLRETNFNSANLSAANLRRSDLGDAELHKAQLDQADFRGADLRSTDLSEASLVKANFGGVTFVGADFQNANLKGATLFGTDFRDTNLDGVDFEEADLREANLNGADLSNVQNLTCDQLTSARAWDRAIRPESLACGAPLPGDFDGDDFVE